MKITAPIPWLVKAGTSRFIEEPLDNRGGRLRLTRKPGLGIAMNIDYLRANKVDGFGE